MYWVQTKFNLNNVIESSDLLEDCKNKKITQIIIGNEGSFQWIEIEKERQKVYPDLKIIYAIYKKSPNGNILWMIQGDVMRNAALLEKAYETGDFSLLSNEITLPVFIPEQQTVIDAFKKYYEKIYRLVGDAYLGMTSENIDAIEKLEIKNEEKLMKLHRVRFLEANDKEITDIRRKINGESDILDNYDMFLKPESFLGDGFEKTKQLLQRITGDFHIESRRKMELWDTDTIRNITIPDNWERFFDREITLPDDQWELKKIHLLCINSGLGFNRRYKDSPRYEEALRRLKKELRIVVDGGFYDYFLIIEDFCRFAKEKNIRINQRGSVVSSLLAYCLTITSIDPLEYGLAFERFLNPHRSNKPDIDIEVPSSQIATFVGYFKEKYTSENVTKITSFNNFGFKNALADVRKQHNVKEKIENLLPKGLKDIDEYFATEEGKATEHTFRTKGYRYLINLAKKMQNVPKSVSVQAAGLIVGEGVSSVPTILKDGERIVELTSDNNELEEMGFYKIDILPSKVLDSVEEAWELIGPKGRERFHYHDRKTYDLLSKGNKSFVFQLKSFGIREVFDKIQPSNLTDIMDGLALFRPGTKEELGNYIKNKKKQTFILNDESGNPIQGASELYPVVKESYGILLYQEQVMLLAMIWAGYTVEEADVLRDIISKKKADEMKRERIKFLARSDKLQRTKRSSEQVFKLIEKFGEYGFTKPHAISYSKMTYETAYLKANHPMEFFVAELNQSLKNYQKINLIQTELKRMGISLFDVDYETSNERFELVPGGIRYGLLGVKNLSKKEIEKILTERN